MLNNIPVRSDAEVWNPTTNERYKDRKGIYENVLEKNTAKTTVKTSYILPDPNIGKLKDTSSYTPQLGVDNEVVELGDYTRQNFTGEYSQRQRAEILRRRAKLVEAIVVALKKSNECDVVQSKLTAENIFGYILNRE
jgi:hypothetical protein